MTMRLISIWLNSVLPCKISCSKKSCFRRHCFRSWKRKKWKGKCNSAIHRHNSVAWNSSNRWQFHAESSLWESHETADEYMKSHVMHATCRSVLWWIHCNLKWTRSNASQMGQFFTSFGATAGCYCHLLPATSGPPQNTAFPNSSFHLLMICFWVACEVANHHLISCPSGKISHQKRRTMPNVPSETQKKTIVFTGFGATAGCYCHLLPATSGPPQHTAFPSSFFHLLMICFWVACETARHHLISYPKVAK